MIFKKNPPDKKMTEETKVDGNIKDIINFNEEIEEKDYGKIRGRCWMFIINNPTDDEKNEFAEYEVRYKVWQLERGEKEGTLHLQGAIYSDKILNLRELKESFPRAVILKAKNTRKVLMYCQKERTRVEGPFEDGFPPAQGKRNDLKDLCRKVIEKKLDLTELAKEDPVSFVRYHKGLKVLRQQLIEDRNFAPERIWIWGKAGVGKTRYAFRRFGSENVYIKDGTQWWDGYENEDCILVDDFEATWPYRDFLRFLDRYKYQGQVKGGYVKINSPVIIITSEFPPEHYYDDRLIWDGVKNENHLNQILRRFDRIIEIKGDPKNNQIPRRETIELD